MSTAREVKRGRLLIERVGVSHVKEMLGNNNIHIIAAAALKQNSKFGFGDSVQLGTM